MLNKTLAFFFVSAQECTPHQELNHSVYTIYINHSWCIYQIYLSPERFMRIYVHLSPTGLGLYPHKTPRRWYIWHRQLGLYNYYILRFNCNKQ